MLSVKNRSKYFYKQQMKCAKFFGAEKSDMRLTLKSSCIDSMLSLRYIEYAMGWSAIGRSSFYHLTTKNMNGPLYKFFVGDHRRLEKLLNRAAADGPKYDMAVYNEFRVGMLKHIKMEENVIIPAAQKVRDGNPLAVAPKIRLDHGALVALLVSPPSPTIVKAIRGILWDHNRSEESQGGLYDLCERLAGEEIQNLMKKVECVSDVPVLPHKTGSNILDATRRALRRAGYNLDDYSSD